MENKTSNKQQVQMFSISNRNSEVLEILNNVDNKSEFICQAILEKAKNNSSSITDSDFENKVKEIVFKLLLNNNLTINTQPIKEDQNFSQNKVADEIPNTTLEQDEDEIDILKSVASQW